MRKTSGISLLLLIFLSLCLIIFSLLSLSESTADLNLNRKSADRTTEYYAAVTRANEILAQIDEQLLTFLRESADTEYPEETYLERCRELVSSDPEIQFSISEPGKSDTPDADRTADSSDTLDSDRSADSWTHRMPTTPRALLIHWIPTVLRIHWTHRMLTAPRIPRTCLTSRCFFLYQSLTHSSFRLHWHSVTQRKPTMYLMRLPPGKLLISGTGLRILPRRCFA